MLSETKISENRRRTAPTKNEVRTTAFYFKITLMYRVRSGTERIKKSNFIPTYLAIYHRK